MLLAIGKVTADGHGVSPPLISQVDKVIGGTVQTLAVVREGMTTIEEGFGSGAKTDQDYRITEVRVASVRVHLHLHNTIMMQEEIEVNGQESMKDVMHLRLGIDGAVAHGETRTVTV